MLGPAWCKTSALLGYGGTRPVQHVCASAWGQKQIQDQAGGQINSGSSSSALIFSVFCWLGFLFFNFGKTTQQNLPFNCLKMLQISSIFTLLWNGSPGLFYLAELKLYTHKTTTTHFPLSPALGNHHSAFCFYEFEYFRCLVWVDSYRICLFVIGLFYLPLCLMLRRINPCCSTWKDFLLF